MWIFSWLIFSLVAGVVGMDRKVGFWGALLLSLLLSPLIGLIIAFASNKKEPEKVDVFEQKNAKKEEHTNNEAINQIKEAYDLWQKGALTEEEYNDIKKKILE